MIPVVFRNLGTDPRFQVTFVLLGLVISVVVGLISDSVGAAGIVLSIFGMVLGFAKYRQERSLGT
jgi:hypothetical protein